METRNRLENIRVIGRFMGYEFIPNQDPSLFGSFKKDRHIFKESYAKWHSDWNEILDVVSKIDGIPNEISNQYFWPADDCEQKNDFRVFRVPNLNDLFSQVADFCFWMEKNHSFAIDNNETNL